MSKSTNYIGSELELFSHAKTWKAYWGNQVLPYLGTRVLEVGAGIGTNTGHLIQQSSIIKEWVCLEPDATLSGQILNSLPEPYKEKVEVRTEYLSDYTTQDLFDSILYIDVIEHIEDDQEELLLASSFLKEGGYLIILVPAHPFLYSDFDKAIGHFRRYNKNMLKQAVGQTLRLDCLRYLDTIGICASTVNKLFLKQSYPTLKQVQFWDTVIVRFSKVIDVLVGYKLGKSLLGIWKKQV
ncbi:methyltransferase family protein [Flavobacteriaceae bacterium MAR_2010_72]|nr:methyltransferase family protein [Flavobacteriaceae bacterium MAR_2010_72]